MNLPQHFQSLEYSIVDKIKLSKHLFFYITIYSKLVLSNGLSIFFSNIANFKFMFFSFNFTTLITTFLFLSQKENLKAFSRMWVPTHSFTSSKTMHHYFISISTSFCIFFYLFFYFVWVKYLNIFYTKSYHTVILYHRYFFNMLS